MKLKRLYWPEVEIECSNIVIFFVAVFLCFVHMGIRVGKVKVVVFDRMRKKHCYKVHRFFIIPKYHYKKAGAEDC